MLAEEKSWEFAIGSRRRTLLGFAVLRKEIKQSNWNSSTLRKLWIWDGIG